MTALPNMAAAFKAPVVSLSLGVTVYLLVQAALLPASGWVADRFGPREVFAVGVLGFTLSSMLCGFSRTLLEFVGARVLQAAAAAVMTPVGRVVMLKAASKAQLVSVMVIASTTMLVAPTLGPPLGGFITTYFGWQWVFFLNAPIGVVGIWLILAISPKVDAAARRPFDVRGFLMLAYAVSASLFALDQLSSARDWRAPVVLLLSGVIATVLALRHLSRTPHPVISLAPLRNRTYAMLVVGAGAAARLPVRAAPFILPLMFQVGMGMSAFRSGLLVMFLNAGDLVLKPVIAGALKWVGFRTALSASALLMSLMVALCAAFSRGGVMATALIVVVLSVCGMARSLLFSGIGALSYAELSDEDTASATSFWNMMQQVTDAEGLAGGAQHSLQHHPARGAAREDVGA